MFLGVEESDSTCSLLSRHYCFSLTCMESHALTYTKLKNVDIAICWCVHEVRLVDITRVYSNNIRNTPKKTFF